MSPALVAAHDDQADKTGKPYIFHPVAVASVFRSEEEQAVALLHDVLEDTRWTSKDLRCHGIPEHIIEAVEALALRADEADGPYCLRVAQNALAYWQTWPITSLRISLKDPTGGGGQ